MIQSKTNNVLIDTANIGSLKKDDLIYTYLQDANELETVYIIEQLSTEMIGVYILQNNKRKLPPFYLLKKEMIELKKYFK